MRTTILIAISLLALRAGAQTPDVNGLYISKADFDAQILTESHTTDELNYCFVNLKGELALVRNGQWQFVRPSEVFGYKNGTAYYRAFAGGFYRIESVGDIVVYSQPGFYKTAKRKFYYFSRTIDSPIKRLARRNSNRIITAAVSEIDGRSVHFPTTPDT